MMLSDVSNSSVKYFVLRANGHDGHGIQRSGVCQASFEGDLISGFNGKRGREGRCRTGGARGILKPGRRSTETKGVGPRTAESEVSLSRALGIRGVELPLPGLADFGRGRHPEPIFDPFDRLKRSVREFWDTTPCGTRDVAAEEGSPGFFRAIEERRDLLEPFIRDFARFSEHRDERVLEVGVGAASDHVKFARAGAKLTGIDLTPHAIALAGKRLALEGLSSDLRVGDVERLPFPDGCFDFVYSWGVIHHTPDTARAARELVRVTRPGGRVCVMIYQRRSLVALQAWILHALLKGRPWRSLGDMVWNHIESVGTKAYTGDEARRLFAGLTDVRVTPVVTPYDIRIGRARFLPRWVQRLVPAALGWFLVIEGRKPSHPRHGMEASVAALSTEPRALGSIEDAA